MFSRKFRSSALVRHRRLFSLVYLVICCLSFLAAANAQQTTAATVTFTCDFPGSDPDHYVISVSDDGSAIYDSNSKLNDSADSQPFHSVFTVSQASSAHVFDLTKRVHYFEGELDSKKKNLASTGVKTLTYKDAQKNTHATYNYSPIPAVQELTEFFQSLSTTLEFGHRLDYYLRYQKLALDQELKEMEEMSNSGGVQEISAVAPILQKILDDPAVIKVTRARAQRLLQVAAAKGK